MIIQRGKEFEIASVAAEADFPQVDQAIDALVVLPDHLHCIWTLPEGDDDNANRWRVIKQTFQGIADNGKTLRRSY